MGTWIGHIAPGRLRWCLIDRTSVQFRLGLFFVVFSLWWHVNNCLRYLRSLVSEKGDRGKRRRTSFQGSTTFPCLCGTNESLRQLPIESILKVLITLTHFAIEIITGYRTEPRPHIIDENAHHTAMLYGFFLGAWVEILVHYEIPLPKRSPQVMGFLAFAIEGLMMVFHLHARTMLDAHIHQLLGLTVVCSMLAALGECFSPNNFWLIVARSFFAMTQGTWFLQAAFVLWPQTTNPLFLWDPESHRSISLLTMSFAYHLAGNAFLLVVVYLIVSIPMSRSRKSNFPDEDEEEESIADYKLILSTNDEDNMI